MADDKKLQLVLVTHERKLLEVECDSVQLPGRLGDFGVLPGHTPMIATLKVGELMYKQGRREHYLALSWGFCEVTDDVVTVLAEFAERPEEIDLEEARREVSEAEAAMNEAAMAGADWQKGRAELEKALTRVSVAQRSSG